MADGDYSIPTFPGVMPMGGGQPIIINKDHHERGLEGKDATLLHSLTDGEAKRALNESVVKNSKEDAIQVVESKFQAAMNQRETEIRIERTARENAEQMHAVRRELDARVRDDGDATRQLIRDMEDKRLRDAKDASFAATLADIQAKLAILLP